jgi:hypothetical protein
MSSQAPSTRITSTLYPEGSLYPEESFSPYTLDEEDKRLGAQPLQQENREKHKQRGSIYRSISWILGFHDKYSLLNCKGNLASSHSRCLCLLGFIWGGAMVGFCLARSVTMNPSRTGALLVPGIENLLLSDSLR